MFCTSFYEKYTLSYYEAYMDMEQNHKTPFLFLREKQGCNNSAIIYFCK